MLRVAIIGLNHLGIVNATLCKNRHVVTLWDSDPNVRTKIANGELPFTHAEPGISNTNYLKMDLAISLYGAVASSNVVWVTYDTPVTGNEDIGDYGYITDRLRQLFPILEDGQILMISSQVPAGFTRRMQIEYKHDYGKAVTFCYSPENIRRGKGLETGSTQARIVLGIDESASIVTTARQVLNQLFQSFGFKDGTSYTPKLLWMPIEAAEMTKHALNAFLGMTIAFANEISVVCDLVGVDSKYIEEALRTEERIGNKLPLRPGEPFTGGTLGRDLTYLEQLAKEQDLPLLKSIHPSNNQHKARLSRKANV